MADVLSALLPPCPTITIDGCLLTFLQTLPVGTGDGLRAGLQAAIDALEKEKARLESIRTSLQSGLNAMNAKILALTDQLQPFDDALAAIDTFLASNVCPELEPIRILIQTLRAFIAAQIAAINLSALQGLLDSASVNIDTLDCYIDALQSMLNTIP